MTVARRDVGRFAGSLVAFLAIAVGIPVGLASIALRQFGSVNPLAGVEPPWRWASDDRGAILTDPIADSALLDGLVRASLCVAWAAVAVIVVTTVLEAVHLVRHGGLPRPDVRGLGWAQRIARSIAAGLIVVVPLAAPTASLADSIRSPVVAPVDGQLHVAPQTQDVVGRAADPADVPNRSAPQVAASSHVVVRGESVYSIAERLAARSGTSTIDVANAIVDANLGRAMGPGERFTNPAYIETGWVLEIPAQYAHHVSPQPPATATAATATTESPPITVDDDDHVYVVQRGDTLWDIADEQLGDPTEWPTIWEHNAGADMGGRTFDDPNLILPGWELDLDGRAPDDAEAPDTAVAPEPAPPPPPPPPPSELDAPVEARPPANDEPTSTAPTEVPPSTVVTAPSGDYWDLTPDEPTSPNETVDEMPSDPQDWPIVVESDRAIDRPATHGPAPLGPAAHGPAAPTTSAAAAEPPIRFDDMVVEPAPSSTDVPVGAADPAADVDADEPSPEAQSPVRLEHAALLAAGVLALVGVRRRQRLRSARPRHRVPEPPTEIVDTERRLRAIDAGERVLRVDIAARAVAASLRDTAAQIGWIQVSLDGDVDVRMTGDATLPPPWVGEGQQWRLAADVPIELIAEDARRVDMPCLALVQVGVTPSGGDVLVDVEACGALAIEASPRQGDEVVAAIAAGLASSLYAEVTHLISVSLPPSALLDHRNAHVVESADAALDLAAALVGTTVANEQTTFTLRTLHTGGEMWEPAVVLLGSVDVDSADDPARLCPPPSHGVAVVAACPVGALTAAGARLVAEREGWRLDGFGATVELTPIGLTVADLQAVEAILDDAQRPLESLELAAAAEIQWADDTPEGPLSAAEVDAAAERTDRVGVDVDDEVTEVVPFEARSHEIVVGVMGSVTVTSRDGVPGQFERSKTIELIAWLATHRERSTRSRARAALWEMDVRDATFANVVSEARRALARLVPPPADEEWVARTLTDQLPVHELVVTDADLIDERVEHARLQPPAAAMETLRPAVELVREMPFAGTSYLWPDAEGITSNLVLLAMTATTEFAGHALSIGDTDGVFWATGQGLQVLPGHEELIALRMRAHARAGDLAGVRQEWDSYERVLVADSWSDGEPSPKLVALRHELLAG